MQKIKNSIRVCLNAVLTTLVGMFITSCEEGPNGGGVVCLYGSPWVEYDVQGEVTNETNEPLKSMQVVVKAQDEYAGYKKGDSYSKSVIAFNHRSENTLKKLTRVSAEYHIERCANAD